MRILVIFQDRPELSHIIQKVSARRELPIDVAEHGSILKNYQNTYYPRFSFTQNRYSIPFNGCFIFAVYLRHISSSLILRLRTFTNLNAQ